MAVEYEVAEGLALITLDRPKVNALDRELLVELGQAFDRAAADGGVRGALLAARGSCFSAGLDLKAVAAMDRPALIEFLEVFDRSFKAVFAFPKPLAAAVAGHAIAGGLVLAATADYCALGQDEYKLGLTELAVGIPFPHLAYEILRDALPAGALRRLVYGADLVGPREAHELGVGDTLVADPLAAAADWLEHVVARPGQTFAHAKRMKRALAWERLAAIDEQQRAALVETMLSPETRQALARAL